MLPVSSSGCDPVADAASQQWAVASIEIDAWQALTDHVQAADMMR
jgi:hypothetical protein